MDTIYLLPGEERCVNFRDANGIPKVHYPSAELQITQYVAVNTFNSQIIPQYVDFFDIFRIFVRAVYI